MSTDGSGRVRSLLLAAALVALSSATARAQVQTIEPGILKVCLYPGFAPFAYKQDGQWQGWDVTFLQSFAQSMDPKLTFEVAEQSAFDGIWLLPGKDVCDIAGTGISDTADRRSSTKGPGDVGCWSATYYGVNRTFLVRTEDYARLDDVRDLAGRTAIVTKGSTANVDLCYRMRLANLNPCVKKGDHPCQFPGLDGFKETTRKEDGACVDIEYPQDNDERNSACAVANNERYKNPACTGKVESNPPFAYGGGYGSVRDLVDTPDQSLAAVWPHCNMGSDFQAYSEPFSFVVRARSEGLLKALNDYIAKTQNPLTSQGSYQPYEGTPIPDLGCGIPPWTKDLQPEVCQD